MLTQMYTQKLKWDFSWIEMVKQGWQNFRDCMFKIQPKTNFANNEALRPE